MFIDRSSLSKYGLKFGPQFIFVNTAEQLINCFDQFDDEILIYCFEDDQFYTKYRNKLVVTKPSCFSNIYVPMVNS